MPNMFSLPYGAIKSTLTSAAKFVKPAAAHMTAGAIAGAGIGMASGEGHTMRDAFIGAGIGLGASGMGRSYLGTFNRGATRTAGTYDAKVGFDAMKSRGMGRWRGINK